MKELNEYILEQQMIDEGFINTNFIKQLGTKIPLKLYPIVYIIGALAAGILGFAGFHDWSILGKDIRKWVDERKDDVDIKELIKILKDDVDFMKWVKQDPDKRKTNGIRKVVEKISQKSIGGVVSYHATRLWDKIKTSK